MANIKSQKITEKKVIESIDAINQVSGKDLDPIAELVNKYGKVDTNTLKLQKVS